MPPKNNKGKGGGKGKQEPKRPPVPSVSDFEERFKTEQPWLNTEEWYGGLADQVSKYYTKAARDGKYTAREKRRMRRLDRRFDAASTVYRDWLNSQPYGGGDTDFGGDGGEGEGEEGGGSGFDQGAFDYMYMLLEEYGLGSLGSVLRGLITDGITDAASLMLALQDTNEWRTRFAGNEILRQNGLGVLSPAEYLALEKSYAQIMRNFGLPPGFYDDPSDYAGFIGNNVSAAELQARVQSYSDLANREDPSIMAQLNSMGLAKGDLLAYMIDPTRAMPLIEKTYKTALIGGAARRAGLVADNDFLGQLADQGITEQQASQGYGMIAGSLAPATTLAEVYGEDYDMRDMETEIFQNDGQAANKRKRLASRERAAFSGSSGAGTLTGNNAGSY